MAGKERSDHGESSSHGKGAIEGAQRRERSHLLGGRVWKRKRRFTLGHKAQVWLPQSGTGRKRVQREQWQDRTSQYGRSTSMVWAGLGAGNPRGLGQGGPVPGGPARDTVGGQWKGQSGERRGKNGWGQLFITAMLSSTRQYIIQNYAVKAIAVLPGAEARISGSLKILSSPHSPSFSKLHCPPSKTPPRPATFFSLHCHLLPYPEGSAPRSFCGYLLQLKCHLLQEAFPDHQSPF